MRSKDARKGEGFTQVKITSRDHLLRVLTLTNKGPRGISNFCFSEKEDLIFFSFWDTFDLMFNGDIDVKAHLLR